MAKPIIAAHTKQKGSLMIQDSFKREPKENTNNGTKTCRRGTPILFPIRA